jgi:NodT family efflux transporter outer membrane factor (OMF) lipoprotein
MVGRAVSRFIVCPTAGIGLRRLPRLGLTLSLALLTACASGVKPTQPDMAMPLAYAVQAQGVLAPAVLDKWWLLYSDAQLTALIERALRQGFTARESLARLHAAQAVRKGALLRFDPQGALRGNAESQRVINLGNTDTGEFAGSSLNGRDATSVTGTARTAGLSLPVSWELDLFGRRAVARRAADADLAAARFEHEAAHSALTAEVARTLFQARGLALQLENAKANARMQQQLGDLLNRRIERGLAASSEADRVAADVAQAEAQAADLSAALAATRRVLLVLLDDGLAPLAGLVVASDIGSAPVVPPTLPGDLLARRPDVRQAEARIRAAAGDMRLAELEFFPQLTLQPAVGLSLQRGALDVSTGFWSLGTGLALPILDRPRLAAELQATSARGRQRVIAYERSVQTAFSEADQALTRLVADRSRVTTLSDGETRARRAYDAALKRFELGSADLQTALDAERVWRSTRTALTGARIDALLRSVQVFQALGGGWPSTPIVAYAPT